MFTYNHKNSIFNRGGQPSTPSSSQDRKYFTQELILEAAQTLQRSGQQHAEHHAPAGCALKPANVQRGSHREQRTPRGEVSNLSQQTQLSTANLQQRAVIQVSSFLSGGTQMLLTLQVRSPARRRCQQLGLSPQQQNLQMPTRICPRSAERSPPT